MPDDLARLDATDQAALVRRKEISPLELANAAIERIERLDPTLNAVVIRAFDLARAYASGPLPEGPFTGVPFLLKNLGADSAGIPSDSGSAFLAGYVSDYDSAVVARYKRAGLVVLGKTNSPEFGLTPVTEPRLHGPTRNPWDTSRTCGGSSGGAAAAVASGMVPAAHGSDGGGSIRIPSSCCGLFGIKPTRGRVSYGPNIGDVMNGLTNTHVITRSVRDSAALLDATSGPEPGDPYWAPPPVRPFLQEVGAEPGPLRIAFSDRDLAGRLLHPDCVAAVHDAAHLCASLGHAVEEASPNVERQELIDAFTPVWAAGCAWSVEGSARGRRDRPLPELFEPLTWALYEKGLRVTGPEYLLAISDLQRIARRIAAFFEVYDLWLTPTLGEPPLPIGALAPDPVDPFQAYLRGFDFVPFTPLANATGQPAMSVPLYWNREGLPIGVHFVARYGDEATLFRLASQLERARPWSERWPARA